MLVVASSVRCRLLSASGTGRRWLGVDAFCTASTASTVVPRAIRACREAFVRLAPPAKRFPTPRERRRVGDKQRCTKGPTAVTFLPPAEHLRTIDAGKHVSRARARDSNKGTATSRVAQRRNRHLNSPSPLLLQGARPGRPAAASERLSPPSSRPALFRAWRVLSLSKNRLIGAVLAIRRAARYGRCWPSVARVPSRARRFFAWAFVEGGGVWSVRAVRLRHQQATGGDTVVRHIEERAS